MYFLGPLKLLTPKRKVSCLQLQDNARLLARESCLSSAQPLTKFKEFEGSEKGLILFSYKITLN